MTASATTVDLPSLNSFLASRSYAERFEASKTDVALLESIKGQLESAKVAIPHIRRYASHIAALIAAGHRFGEATCQVSSLPIFSAAAPATAAAAAADDDEVDLFGSDEEQVDEEAERIKAERLAAYHAKKALKPVIAAKSEVTLDIKPYEAETDMNAMANKVREINLDGLVWGKGAPKFVPVAYGVKKLVITCVVEDEKVSTDDLIELIEQLEDLVQSVEIVSFNKI